MKEEISQQKKIIVTRIYLAEMACKQGFDNIATKALEHKRQLENELARIQEYL